MNATFKSTLAIVVTCLFCSVTQAVENDANESGTEKAPSTIEKTGKAIERGSNAAVRGVKRGAEAAAHGIERGAQATGRAVHKVAKKIGISDTANSEAETGKQ